MKDNRKRQINRGVLALAIVVFAGSTTWVVLPTVATIAAGAIAVTIVIEVSMS